MNPLQSDNVERVEARRGGCGPAIGGGGVASGAPVVEESNLFLLSFPPGGRSEEKPTKSPHFRRRRSRLQPKEWA